MPESVLNKVGIPAANLYFDESKIAKQLSNHADHITKEVLKKIPGILQDPIVILEDEEPGNVNVFGDVWVGNSPVLVGIIVSHRNVSQTVINKVRTVHARRDAAQKLTADKLLYVNPDKKRTQS